MADTIDELLVVGGGDVGLLTALSVRKLNPEMAVTVVDEFDEPVPAVGTSTFQKILDVLHHTLEIPQLRFVREVRPVWKTSAYFRDWCGFPAFHYPFDPPEKYAEPGTPNALERYVHYYEDLYRSPSHRTTCEEVVEQGKSPWYYGPNGDLDRITEAAYQLDGERFNGFLRTLCGERGIDLVDDRVTDVETTGDRIDAVRGVSTTYDADLYVDASGFNRVLRREQTVAYRDFAFPLDSAFNVGVDRALSDVVPATVIESGEYGWFWQIDTYDERDLGYVFASEYVDDDAAREEFLEFVDGVSTSDADPVDPDDVRRYGFDSGYYEKAWVENCLAIGNAEGFVEPIQSTALTANASNAVDFATLLSGHGRIADDNIREAYNATVERTWESIYDFIAVHYHYADGETPFWEDISAIEVRPRLERIIESFDAYGFDWSVDQPDGVGLSDLRLFALPDFYEVMRSMDATSEFYEDADVAVSNEVRRQEDQKYKEIREQVEQYHLSLEELYRGVLDVRDR